jgi:hypothetical protein
MSDVQNDVETIKSITGFNWIIRQDDSGLVLLCNGQRRLCLPPMFFIVKTH